MQKGVCFVCFVLFFQGRQSVSVVDTVSDSRGLEREGTLAKWYGVCSGNRKERFVTGSESGNAPSWWQVAKTSKSISVVETAECENGSLKLLSVFHRKPVRFKEKRNDVVILGIFKDKSRRVIHHSLKAWELFRLQSSQSKIAVVKLTDLFPPHS